ncbi:hypothetical protein Tco_0933036 [Tanacetum coccineum]
MELNQPFSGYFKKSKGPRSGGSILNLLEDVVKVGHVMGYNMEGCVSNMEEIIKSQEAGQQKSPFNPRFSNMGSFRSKEDDVAKISVSVYITNFPDNCTAKDLFNKSGRG